MHTRFADLPISTSPTNQKPIGYTDILADLNLYVIAKSFGKIIYVRKRVDLLDAYLKQDRFDRHEHRVIESTFPNNNNQLAVLNGILANQPLICVSHPFSP